MVFRAVSMQAAVPLVQEILHRNEVSGLLPTEELSNLSIKVDTNWKIYS